MVSIVNEDRWNDYDWNLKCYSVYFLGLIVFFCFFLLLAILKDADLNTMSAKKVRLQLEGKFDCKLFDRKDEIDAMVMDFVNSADSEPDIKEEVDSDEEEEETPKAQKRAAPAKKISAKKIKVELSDSDSDEGVKPTRKGKKSKDDDGKKSKAKKVSYPSLFLLYPNF